MGEKKVRRIPLHFWRRLSQLLFVAAFLFLFRKTDYAGADQIPYAVNIFFRWDPLVAASAMLAARALIALLLPALAVVALTLILGRFFCGWVCPLGSLLDASHKLIRPRRQNSEESGRWRSCKYYLLVIILAAAAFGVPLVGYFDPFSILVRGLTISVDPAFNLMVSTPFDLLYQHAPAGVSDVSEPVYAFLRDTILPYKQSAFTLVIPTLLILALVFALEKIERRFWCRNLCPLGAMLSLFSRRPFLRMQPGRACKAKGCRSCIEVCRMGAIDEEGRVSPEACNLCLDCIDECETGIISFRFKQPKFEPAPMGVSRRGFAGALTAGLLLPAFMKVRAINGKPDPFLIRPPGALGEDEFLARCVRCGECMKVCITNGLQPAAVEAGAVGVFSPMLVPRLGNCEYNCTLCGQVCPTGAIGRLLLDDKHLFKIGRAYFDHNRCLPWARGISCLVCEEMCPVPDKAIRMREETAINPAGEEVRVKRPYLVPDLCIGCGTCEKKCPLPGEAAVRVTSEGEERNPDNMAPAGYGEYQG